jgi:hypothetical protein
MDLRSAAQVFRAAPCGDEVRRRAGWPCSLFYLITSGLIPALMPANLTILHHFSVSLATNLLIAAGVIDIHPAELGRPCVQYRIAKGRFDFPIELPDNCGGRALGRSTPISKKQPNNRAWFRRRLGRAELGCRNIDSVRIAAPFDDGFWSTHSAAGIRPARKLSGDKEVGGQTAQRYSLRATLNRSVLPSGASAMRRSERVFAVSIDAGHAPHQSLRAVTRAV